MNDAPRKRILIVDDEGPVRTICKRVLEPLGYTVYTAPDGDAALSWLEGQSCELVMTDYHMPGTWNGVDLGQAIKKLWPQMQVIVMTAFPDVENAIGTLRMGGFDFMVKPFDQSELIERVKACFARRADPAT